jgi:energy-coupling factor transporter ATP-binding protein EcfA2
MFIDRFGILDVRGITNLEWAAPQDQKLGWHVVIGDNGSGKSTVLRAIALALVGSTEAEALRENWSLWLRAGEAIGLVDVHLDRDLIYDGYSGKGKQLQKYLHKAMITFVKKADGSVMLQPSNTTTPSRHIWGKARGWFSAGYGPFRRFSGGDKDTEKLYYSRPVLARHLSLFGENVALAECLTWLQSLKFKQLENDPQGRILDAVTAFVNQNEFLPHGTKLEEVTSRKVVFRDATNEIISADNLSDGYRSILSMTFELIRQMAAVFDPNEIFSEDRKTILVPGVVLIDEIDAHLHPSWQRRIGQWFVTHFPKIQFIVTTHSPLICQAAEHGSIFRLPKPGSSDIPRMVEGEDRKRLIYGDVLDAYSTDMFGEEVGRSETGRAQLEQLAELNTKEVREGLTETEMQKQSEIRSALPTQQNVLKPDATNKP